MELYKVTYYLECTQKKILNPEEKNPMLHTYQTNTFLKSMNEIVYGKSPVDAIKRWENSHKKKKDIVQLQEIIKYEVHSSEE